MQFNQKLFTLDVGYRFREGASVVGGTTVRGYENAKPVAWLKQRGDITTPIPLGTSCANKLFVEVEQGIGG